MPINQNYNVKKNEKEENVLVLKKEKLTANKLGIVFHQKIMS